MDTGRLCYPTATCTLAIIARGSGTAKVSMCSKTVLDMTENGGTASNMAKEPFGTLTERDTRVRNDVQK